MLRFLLFLLLGCSTPALAGTTLYVAPGGRDGWSGSRPQPTAAQDDGPLATLTGARDALRRLRAAGPLDGPVRVELAAGEYALAEPLVLEPHDSGTAAAPVRWEAALGAEVTISGGRRITGFQEVEPGLWSASVPREWRFEHLWVNGMRATRARTPNAVPRGPLPPGATQAEPRSHESEWLQVTSAATAPVAGVKLAAALEKTALVLLPDQVAALEGLSPAELREVNAVVYHSWNASRHRVAGIDFTNGTVQFTGPARWGFFQSEPYHRIFLENYRAALDAPGEWFLDLKGTLFYRPRPGEQMASAAVVAPVARRWLEGRSDPAAGRWLEYHTFFGLHFAHTAFTLPDGGFSDGQADAVLPAGVEFTGAHHVEFTNCSFAHTATYGVGFRRGCADCRVTHCQLEDLGAGGVCIGETEVPVTEAHRTHHIQVENCLIHGGGRHFPGSIGLWIGHSGDNSLVHNDVADFFYSAISIGWVWGFKPSLATRNRVEWNHLHHLGWGVLSDLGAVYTLGPSEGTVVRHNTIHDIACYSYGGWGLYPDEGSTGILYENNLVYRTESAGFHQHYGENNVVRNNIFALAREMQVRHSRTEDHLAFSFTRNIVLWREGLLLGHVKPSWQGTQVKLDHNLYWPLTKEPVDFAGKTFTEWQATGQDAGSLFADPLFQAAEQDDFHLAQDSPAYRLGFVPFAYEEAGVTGSPEWRALAEAKYPPMDFSALKIEPTPLVFHQDFEQVALGERMGALRTQTGGVPAALQLSTEAPSEGRKCLQLTDGPELKPPYNPHLYFSPRHRHGATTLSFALRAEPKVEILHEWRNAATPYRTGPMFRLVGGKLIVNGQTLLEVPPGEWLHFTLEAQMGEGAPGTWDLEVQRGSAAPQRFAGLKFVHPEMRELEWVGFISSGKDAARWWLDDLTLQHR